MWHLCEVPSMPSGTSRLRFCCGPLIIACKSTSERTTPGNPDKQQEASGGKPMDKVERKARKEGGNHGLRHNRPDIAEDIPAVEDRPVEKA